MALKLKQSGDTIVEVLMAIAVLALVITFAYNLVIRSSSNTEVTQQRNEAVQLAQSQIEFLRNYSQQNHGTEPPYFNGTPQGATNGGGGCFDLTTGAYPPVPQFASAPNNCTSSDGIFTVSINQAEVGSTNLYLYTIEVTWQRSVTGQTNNVTLYYELAT